MICSSSKRLILVEDRATFLLGEDAGKWAGLAQAPSIFVVARQEV
jgi:hypothetical protein